MKPYSFKEWLKMQRKLFKRTHESVTCYECYGSGETDCECCGHERDCEECNGTGVTWEVKEGLTAMGSLAPSQKDYYLQVMKEYQEIRAFTGKRMYQHMMNFAREFKREDKMLMSQLLADKRRRVKTNTQPRR